MMCNWALRSLKRKRCVITKICLLLLLCVHVPFYLLSKGTPSLNSKYKRLNASHKTHMFTGYWSKDPLSSGVRLRKHAHFRQTRFIVRNRAQLKENKSKALNFRKRGFVDNFKRKEPQTRVMFKKHATSRQKGFVEERNTEHLGKTGFTRHNDRKQTKLLSRTTPMATGSILLHTQVKIFNEWRNRRQTACGQLVELYPGQFVSLRSAIFRKNLVWCKNLGGEDIEQVTGQAEKIEYYKIHKGFFETPCNETLAEFKFPTSHQGHLVKWINNINSAFTSRRNIIDFIEDFTIVIKRYEYVNIYHTMTDFYNAFLVMSFFKKSPNETTIIFFDAHPKGSLDVVWKTLFGTVLRASRLPKVVQFRHVIWGIPGYDSLLSQFYIHKSLPLLEEFRAFFLKQHGVINTRSIDCKRGLRLVVIFRRDYVAHPRNPAGEVERKIGNENELLKVANNTGLFSSISGVQLDKLLMREQLMYISSTDILVGMHGAGLTHAIFLPEHAGVIELVPQYFPKLNHFLNISKWRHLKYLRWKNLYSRYEMQGKRTRIPDYVFRALLFAMMKKLCRQQVNTTETHYTATSS